MEKNETYNKRLKPISISGAGYILQLNSGDTHINNLSYIFVQLNQMFNRCRNDSIKK